MVPLRAASNEKGAPALNEGGSTRPVLRRLERIPARLERVGDRPAGTEGMTVLSLAAGDLGWRKALGRDLTVRVLDRDGVALVRTKAGLKDFGRLSEPLDRLENRIGSTFSVSSTSTDSEAFRLMDALGVRAKLSVMLMILTMLNYRVPCNVPFCLFFILVRF